VGSGVTAHHERLLVSGDLVSRRDVKAKDERGFGRSALRILSEACHTLLLR